MVEALKKAICFAFFKTIRQPELCFSFRKTGEAGSRANLLTEQIRLVTETLTQKIPPHAGFFMYVTFDERVFLCKILVYERLSR